MTAYQILPPLTDEEYDALKSDIATRGVQVPIEIDEHGNVLDGHHRLRACEELGITTWPSIIRAGMSEDEKIEHALVLNLARRHMTPMQRGEAVVELRKRGWSLRRIADQLQIGRGTVEREVSTVPIGTVELPERIMGKDGRSRPAHRPAVIVKSPREARRVQAALAQVDHADVPQMADYADLKAIIRDDRREAKRACSANTNAPASGERYQLLEGDLSVVMAGMAADSVDAIITDPPYPAEYLPLYALLAESAARVLRPGGSLVVMCGQSYLPVIYESMCQHLNYYWTLAYLTPGQAPHLWQKQVNTQWKPVLWFVKGEYSGDSISDVAKSDTNDKRFHDWGQSESGMACLVERFSREGELILDPFCGGGTTGVVAVQLKRRFIGIDIDAEAIAITAGRLIEAGKE